MLVHTAGSRRRDQIGKSLNNPYEIDIHECFKHKSTSVLREYLSTDDLPASNNVPKANEKHVPFAFFTDSLQRILPERVTLVPGPVTFSSLNYLEWSSRG